MKTIRLFEWVVVAGMLLVMSAIYLSLLGLSWARAIPPIDKYFWDRSGW